MANLKSCWSGLITMTAEGVKGGPLDGDHPHARWEAHYLKESEMLKCKEGAVIQFLSLLGKPLFFGEDR